MNHKHPLFFLQIIIPIALIFIMLIFLPRFSSMQKWEGQKIYKRHCASCHGKEGNGLKNLFPAIRESSITTPQDLVCLIRNGRNSGSVVAMPPNQTITSKEMKLLLIYLYKEIFRISVPNLLSEEVEKGDAFCNP